MVCAGLYQVGPTEHGLLRDALEKPSPTDSAVNFERENSRAWDFGFAADLSACCFEIVQERLEREFNID